MRRYTGLCLLNASIVDNAATQHYLDAVNCLMEL